MFMRFYILKYIGILIFIHIMVDVLSLIYSAALISYCISIK